MFAEKSDLARIIKTFGLGMVVFASLSHANPSDREYSAIAVRAVPHLKCTVDAADRKDRAVVVYSNQDGYIRFHAVRAGAPGDVKQLNMSCMDEKGRTSRYKVDLTSDEIFEPHPLDVSQEPGRDRAALVGDPMNYPARELIHMGYGPRPDPTDAPEAYRRWLRSATSPAHLVSTHHFADRAASPMPQRAHKFPITDAATSTSGGWWSGSVLAGAAPYSRIEGIFTVPTALPGALGTGYTGVSIWTGLDEGGNLLQSGIDMDTSPTVANYVVFRELCCGNPTSTNVDNYSVSPGDQLYTLNWYCDAQGYPNINGGYGCSIVHDLTSHQEMSCILANPANGGCPSAVVQAGQTVGQTAEFIVENASPQVDPAHVATSWPVFTPQLLIEGDTWSDNAQKWLTVGSDSNVTIFTDGVNDPLTHMTVSIAAPDSTYWSVTPTPVPQAHSIWRSTGAACAGVVCGGWAGIDDNTATRSISGGSWLTQLHTDGSLWGWNGRDCTGRNCYTWDMLDNNPLTIAVAASDLLLYQLHSDGAIWRFTGAICSNNVCPGWTQLDQNPDTIAIAAGESNYFYQLHRSGQIWMYTHTPCAGGSCPGWNLLDGTPGTIAIAADDQTLYKLGNTGEIWKWSLNFWTMLDDNPAAVSIAASGGHLYQKHSDGSIWAYTGQPCGGKFSGRFCPGWSQLDDNPQTQAIVADGDVLFQLHADGQIWKWTGAACNGTGCPGWVMMDDNSKTTQITAMGGTVYQLHGYKRSWSTIFP